MGRRIALVVSAGSGAELSGGRRDALLVFSLLTDDNLGCCDLDGPEPIVNCTTREQFQRSWHALMDGWNQQDQLLFYFSGHGVVKNAKYSLAFGSPPAQQYVPFDHIASDLQTYGVRRAVLILDACHSGAAVRGVKDAEHGPKLEQELPDGIVVLASCRESESSFELEDGTGSVFTHLLAKGIRTGLGGKPTAENVIGPDDLLNYINERLGEPAYAEYPQRPTYQVNSADRTVWIARNMSAPTTSSAGPSRTRAYTRDELHILYERTERARHPCPGATLDCLDWTLVAQHALAAKTPLEPNEPQEAAARRLGLYSSLSEELLHNAAVLCFARAPHTLLPHARSIFIRGERSGAQISRIDVLGPLPRQVDELTELVMADVFRRLGWRPTDDAATSLAKPVREAISNAITHRDYGRNELVRVATKDDAIEITNPGAFPNGTTFESLMSADYSAPKDAAIAWYLTTLLAYEGVGRGFAVYRAFRKAAGDAAIQCEVQPTLGQLKLTIQIPIALALTGAVGPAPSASLAATPLPSHTIHGLGAETTPVSRVPVAQPNLVQRTGSEEIVGGRYRLGPALGSGGSGSVYLAEDIKLTREVAVKILPKRFVTAEARARFLREGTLPARIDHPGIVTVYDVGEEADILFIVMELVSGTNLQTLIAGSSQLREHMPEAFFLEVAWLMHEIADALAAAHEMFVIHRDIKPANVIVEDSGRPRILDFGISRAGGLEDSKLTLTGVVIGTPQYMSPEQFYGDRIDARTDVYSLGAVMYELLCQRLPFHGDSVAALALSITQGAMVAPRSLVPNIPAELERICLKALQRDLAQRYASARDLLRDLQSYLPQNPRYESVNQDWGKLWAPMRSLLARSPLAGAPLLSPAGNTIVDG